MPGLVGRGLKDLNANTFDSPIVLCRLSSNGSWNVWAIAFNRAVFL